MQLIDEVRTILNTLNDHGWGDLFQRHGLDITATDLATELTRPLSTIDRTIPGFEDFAPEGSQGITPGSPAHSLVYHALASPYVHPTVNGNPSDNQNDYATLDELDTIENYLFSLARKRLSDFDNPVIGVFAYQYRVGSRSPHRAHADMAYSRTGVSRVGTHNMNYDRRRRSFWVVPNSGQGIAVCPARFGVFIAEFRQGNVADMAILHGESDDRFRSFLFPVHKLFPGNECLADEQIDAQGLSVLEFHLNEKLRRTHLADTPGVIPVMSGFRPNESPFVRKSIELVNLDKLGASWLLVPQTPSDERLVHLAEQRNDDSGNDEIVRFHVPPRDASNRFWTSFQIPGQNNGRAAPEYVNIRQKVTNPTGSIADLEDLNQLPPDQFKQTVAQGNYEAAHFLDDSCDGALIAQVAGQRGIVDQLASFAAYSLVTAPDFLPLTDQVDIQDWAKQTLADLREHFAQGGPRPLSNGRRSGTTVVGGLSRRGRMPNPALIDPRNDQHMAFDRNNPVNITITAIIGPAPLTSSIPADIRRNVSVSFLPDAAADVFAPGWDISQHGDALGEFYNAYGLGSPFPEDAKLCALLNSFWPAAAPDTSRTFGIQFAPTALPMLDVELGYHPHHPRSLAGSATAGTGWDGEYGPFLERVNGTLVVNFADRDRSDYTRNALDGNLSIATTASVDSHEMTSRMAALRDCIRVLPQPGRADDEVSNTRLWLVVAEKVDDWSGSGTSLNGPGYLYEFVLPGAELPKEPSDLSRSRKQVRFHFVCQISGTRIRWNVDGGTFQLVNRS